MNEKKRSSLFFNFFCVCLRFAISQSLRGLKMGIEKNRRVMCVQSGAEKFALLLIPHYNDKSSYIMMDLMLSKAYHNYETSLYHWNGISDLQFQIDIESRFSIESLIGEKFTKGQIFLPHSVHVHCTALERERDSVFLLSKDERRRHGKNWEIYCSKAFLPKLSIRFSLFSVNASAWNYRRLINCPLNREGEERFFLKAASNVLLVCYVIHSFVGTFIGYWRGKNQSCFEAANNNAIPTKKAFTFLRKPKGKKTSICKHFQFFSVFYPRKACLKKFISVRKAEKQKEGKKSLSFFSGNGHSVHITLHTTTTKWTRRVLHKAVSPVHLSIACSRPKKGSKCGEESTSAAGSWVPQNVNMGSCWW